MKKRYGINDVNSLKDRGIFFDANIIIFLFFSTHQNSDYVSEYSKMYGTLLKNKQKMYIDATVLSEVVNSTLRIACSKYHENELTNFKDFRKSPTGIKEIRHIYSVIVNKILPLFDIAECSFSKSDLVKILHNGSTDFNDKLIGEICIRNKFVLLTNDTDFTNSDLDILSCHPSLFKYRN